MLKKGDYIGIVRCSDPQPPEFEPVFAALCKEFSSMGLHTVVSDFIYQGNAPERARAVMELYSDSRVKAIFDISGGNMANEVLPYLDYEKIASSSRENDTVFFGYSDLTTVLNAIYTKTGRASVLYSMKNLVGGEHPDRVGQEIIRCQQERVRDSLLNGGNSLFQINYDFIQGNTMKGILIGGNIRCFLKLAGTPYLPDVTDKILLLEARSGTESLMRTYLSQLKQLSVFERISGILLGTFTAMDREKVKPDIEELVKEFAGEDIPIARTKEIGHGADAKAVWIGREITM